MADRLKPDNQEIVERIRSFEKELFKKHNFKLYRNYHVPEALVKNSKRVLSFGVGYDANFEKSILSITAWGKISTNNVKKY